MTKSPIINALAALFYIVFVSSVMFFGMENAQPEDTILAPIAMLSLLTLSAAVMGYLFFYQSVQLYLDGKKKAAVDFFLQTLGIFAGITAVLFLLLFSGILPFR